MLFCYPDHIIIRNSLVSGSYDRQYASFITKNCKPKCISIVRRCHRGKNLIPNMPDIATICENLAQL